MFRRVLLITLFAVASASAASVPKHYSQAEWKAIKAKFIEMPRPDYPFALRRLHFVGSGIFRMYINGSGEVTAIKILKSTGHRELDAEAMKAFIRWRAQPGPKWEVDMPVTFTQRPA